MNETSAVVTSIWGVLKTTFVFWNEILLTIVRRDISVRRTEEARFLIVSLQRRRLINVSDICMVLHVFRSAPISGKVYTFQAIVVQSRRDPNSGPGLYKSASGMNPVLCSVPDTVLLSATQLSSML